QAKVPADPAGPLHGQLSFLRRKHRGYDRLRDKADRDASAGQKNRVLNVFDDGIRMRRVCPEDFAVEDHASAAQQHGGTEQGFGQVEKVVFDSAGNAGNVTDDGFLQVRGNV